MTRSDQRATERDQGFVLVVVLWLLAIMTVVTLSFGRRALLDATAAAYALDQTQAAMQARGAVERGVVEVMNKIYNDKLVPTPELRMGDHLGQPWAKTKYLDGDEKYFEVGENFERDYIAYVIRDAERYISVNSAPRDLLEGIEVLGTRGVKTVWSRRTKEIYKGEGVSVYQAVEELRYQRGIDEEQWFGEDEDPGLRDILTVWGDGRININTASREVLLSIPELQKDERAVDTIIAYRNGPDGEAGTADDTGFASLDDITPNTGIEGDSIEAIRRFCKTSADYFIITGVATRQGGKVRAACTAVIDRSGTILDWQERTLGA